MWGASGGFLRRKNGVGWQGKWLVGEVGATLGWECPDLTEESSKLLSFCNRLKAFFWKLKKNKPQHLFHTFKALTGNIGVIVWVSFQPHWYGWCSKYLFRSEGGPSHVTHVRFIPSITHCEGVVGFVNRLWGGTWEPLRTFSKPGCEWKSFSVFFAPDIGRKWALEYGNQGLLSVWGVILLGSRNWEIPSINVLFLSNKAESTRAWSLKQSLQAAWI